MGDEKRRLWFGAIFWLILLLVGPSQGAQASVQAEIGTSERVGNLDGGHRIPLKITFKSGARFYGPEVEKGTLQAAFPPQLSLETKNNVQSVHIEWPSGADENGVYHTELTAFLVVAVQDAEAPASFKGVLTGLYCDEQCVPYRLPLAWHSGEQGSASLPPLFLLIALAFLGGLLLNFMPCVLPVLSLKVSLFQKKQAASLKPEIAYMLLGILSFFAVYAGILSGVRFFGGVIGWGLYFQNPYFMAFFAWLMVMLSVRHFGVLPPLAGPGFVLPIQTSLPVRAFLDGFLLAIIATPCTAPFLGLVSGVALTAPVPVIFLVFLFVGVGFGFPGILFLIFPSFLSRALPKPGPWMSILEKVMGGLLVLSALWALWVLSRQTSFVTIVLFFGVFSGSILLSHWFKQFQKLAVFFSLLGVFVPALGPMGALTEQGPGISLESLKQQARTDVVLVTVSADWCLNCQYNESVLKRAAVKEFLTQKQVKMIHLDWTNRSEEIRIFLKAHGRIGIPFAAVYGPGLPDGRVLPEVLTAHTIKEGVQAAQKRT